MNRRNDDMGQLAQPAGKITSGRQFVMLLAFEIPPGVTDDQMHYKVAENVQVSIGLVPLFAESTWSVRDPVGPKVSI